jgi:hypothetical protein
MSCVFVSDVAGQDRYHRVKKDLTAGLIFRFTIMPVFLHLRLESGQNNGRERSGSF